ncbi:hypothetical protein ACIPSE_44850 [Streptomyces sp. NPDC090106]|uniref:hypothetical protein n=1 Tax=Streptomyces sp. NPDC090106 TaxID=3365946 RepID=UPI00380C3375
MAGDLERILKEQERLGAEIDALQSQLADLDRDRTVLLSLQEALGTATVAPTPDAAPRPAEKKTTTAPAKGTKTRAKKSAPATSKARSAKKTAPAKATEPQQSSLVALAREFLAGQSEPRSAAEIAEALTRQHPDRTIKATVVRTTLEGLVAKNQAQRNKQGSSVFYTTPTPATPPADSSQNPDQTT